MNSCMGALLCVTWLMYIVAAAWLMYTVAAVAYWAESPINNAGRKISYSICSQVSVCCSVLQILQHTATYLILFAVKHQCVAVCCRICNTLQHILFYLQSSISVLQCVADSATHCNISYSICSQVSVCCSVLQTLQHTATYLILFAVLNGLLAQLATAVTLMCALSVCD